MASAPSIDYAAAAMAAKRVCCACARISDAERVRRDPAWEPVRSGWRCGDCTRAREREVAGRARALIAKALPRRWELVLRTPRHGVYDECLQCEAILQAHRMLLARGVLDQRERGELAAALLGGL
jgi:hypothetical protein